MSVVLHPQRSFTVVRQIANHLDTDTNYVRAVIRNAYTDEIIATLDLADRGGQRFSKNWQVPADPSGEGFYVSIVTSVFTDSGYAAKNRNYGDEESTYLVQDRVPAGRGGGGVDSYTVRRILREELDKQPKAEPFDYDRLPKPQEFSDRTEELLGAIEEAKPVTVKEIDLAPVLGAILSVGRAVEDKPVTPPTDLSDLQALVQRASEENGIDFQELKDLFASFEQRIVDLLVSTIKKAMDETEFTSTFSTRAQPKKQSDQEKPSFDASRISL